MRKLIFFLLCSIVTTVYGQEKNDKITWDDTSSAIWPKGFVKVSIPSSVDSTQQNAYIYKSPRSGKQPLIVSLHTWSGNYKQKDPLCKEIMTRGWNYIHPDFRGPNNHWDAMGSQKVIADIEDAIKFALKQTNSDSTQVHIVGVSGGGYATLLAYMNLRYPVASFSAWAPISNIEAWYDESVGRKQKYASDIMKAIGSEGKIDREEARRRSPLLQAYPKQLRQKAPLYIYEGIHDGYKGSVPITHSLLMYNRIVGELKYGTSNLDEIMVHATSDSNLVSPKEIISLLASRNNPQAKNSLYGRNIHLQRDFGQVHLVIFEGGHEQLPQALALIPYQERRQTAKNILTLGDSNGAISNNWPTQLSRILPKSKVINISRSGRTIGFYNNSHKNDLNALVIIDSLLTLGKQRAGSRHFDYIVVCLGTNDFKYQYKDSIQTVMRNFDSLLEKIQHFKWGYRRPRLIYVTPPPMESKAEKYKDGNKRLAENIDEIMNIAKRHKAMVVDIFHPMQGIHGLYAKDGIHMNGDGQKIVASILAEKLSK